MTGKPWTEQTPTLSILEVVRQIRQDAKDGPVDLATWDHNHPDRTGDRSNKQAMIAGAQILHARGVELGSIDKDAAYAALLELALGPEETL
jgi:hypothetical protein